jgi:predicted nucleotidyltransferase
MGLSKRHLSANSAPVSFDIEILAKAIAEAAPEAVFAYLFGSSAPDLTVRPGSDLDLALFLDRPSSLELYQRVEEACAKSVGEVRCDIGILNGAEPVFRMEALKGHLLFKRDEERWLRFYSLTCREYESQIFHYKKQLNYRREANAS